MSVTFMWEAVRDARNFQYGTSDDRNALEKTFGQMPVELGVEHAATLRAMSAAKGTTGDVYSEIADKIDKVGRIRVWPEY